MCTGWGRGLFMPRGQRSAAEGHAGGSVSVRTSEVALVVICGCLQMWLWDVVLEANPDTTKPPEQRRAELGVSYSWAETPSQHL